MKTFRDNEFCNTVGSVSQNWLAPRHISCATHHLRCDGIEYRKCALSSIQLKHVRLCHAFTHTSGSMVPLAHGYWCQEHIRLYPEQATYGAELDYIVPRQKVGHI